jgi:hypothetical protein
MGMKQSIYVNLMLWISFMRKVVANQSWSRHHSQVLALGMPMAVAMSLLETDVMRAFTDAGKKLHTSHSSQTVVAPYAILTGSNYVYGIWIEKEYAHQ